MGTVFRITAAAVVAAMLTAACADRRQNMESEKITVTVLSLAGCSATPGTIELIKKVAAEEK